MCLGFLPPGGTRFRKHRRPNGGGAKNEKSWNTVRRSAKKRKQKKKQQLTLQDCFGFDVSSLSEEENEAIEASGDPLIDKESGSVRFAFQNIHGISIREGLHVMPEIATMGALQIDVAALTETNVHWNQANREKNGTTTVHSSGSLKSSMRLKCFNTKRGWLSTWWVNAGGSRTSMWQNAKKRERPLGPILLD